MCLSCIGRGTRAAGFRSCVLRGVTRGTRERQAPDAGHAPARFSSGVHTRHARLSLCARAYCVVSDSMPHTHRRQVLCSARRAHRLQEQRPRGLSPSNSAVGCPGCSPPKLTSRVGALDLQSQLATLVVCEVRCAGKASFLYRPRSARVGRRGCARCAVTPGRHPRPGGDSVAHRCGGGYCHARDRRTCPLVRARPKVVVVCSIPHPRTPHGLAMAPAHHAHEREASVAIIHLFRSKRPDLQSTNHHEARRSAALTALAFGTLVPEPKRELPPSRHAKTHPNFFTAA